MCVSEIIEPAYRANLRLGSVQNLLRMHRIDASKALEIRSVESEQMVYAMHFKHRCRMSIVDLNAAHLMGFHEAEPSRKDGIDFL